MALSAQRERRLTAGPIFFTEMHLADIKACLAALESDDSQRGVSV
jgi:hypothetical protein